MLLLAGRDHGTTNLPEAGREHRVLRGYKSMELIIAGKPLMVHLIERLRATGAFDPIFIAGPAKVHGELQDMARIVDTDGNFGENIQLGLAAMRAQCPESSLVACMTSDLLPDPDELQLLVDDFHRHQPLDFWYNLCRAEPEQSFGTSSWKPKYLVRPEGEETAIPTLPGHLVIANPDALYTDFIYPLFERAYRTRNRPAWRRLEVLWKAFTALFLKDLRRALTCRVPDVIWGMVGHGIPLIYKIITPNGIAQHEMEDRLRRMWVRTSHRWRHPKRRGRIAIYATPSFARDIDTEEEAREITQRVENEERFETAAS
jgi:hypothetical protein